MSFLVLVRKETTVTDRKMSYPWKKSQPAVSFLSLLDFCSSIQSPFQRRKGMLTEVNLDLCLIKTAVSVCMWKDPAWWINSKNLFVTTTVKVVSNHTLKPQLAQVSVPWPGFSCDCLKSCAAKLLFKNNLYISVST